MLDVVLEAPPAGHFPNVLFGAVHYLLLGGLDHPLAAVYAGASDADPGPLFEDVCVAHRTAVPSRNCSTTAAMSFSPSPRAIEACRISRAALAIDIGTPRLSPSPIA